VTIDVSGTLGAAFMGNCEIDGETRDLSGVIPDRSSVEAHELKYSIIRSDESGELSVKVSIDGNSYGKVSSGNGLPGVRGWVKNRLFKPLYWIECFDPINQTDCLAPPS